MCVDGFKTVCCLWKNQELACFCDITCYVILKTSKAARDPKTPSIYCIAADCMLILAEFSSILWSLKKIDQCNDYRE
jgi:hypothetical protein